MRSDLLLRKPGLLALALLGCWTSNTLGDDPCARDPKGNCKPINKTCKALAGNQIDWECVLGPGALSEVTDHDGEFKTCPDATESEPCSRFVVAKDAVRAEVKVKDGIDGFPFRQGEEYIFKYSFKAKEGMQVGKLFTILGQLKGDTGDEMIKGVPIYSIVANNNGIMVRFSNLDDTIPNYHPGLDDFLSWEDALGKWVHVKVTTVLGESMEVELSGAVEGKAVWPSHLEPIAWHRDAYWVRLKLGLYHSAGNVANGEVEYKDISVEGPNGIIRSGPVSSAGPCAQDSEGNCKPINKACKALAGNQIDWECVLGPGALSEVTDHGGEFKTCPDATESEPCSRFFVAKDAERAEVKVKDGIDGFPFRQGEEYIFKYSFKAKEGMQVGKLFTILGQLKGDTGDEMIKGVPIYSIVANNNGIMVRFSNLDDTIPNYHPGLDDFLSWEDALGKWVHVKVTTVLGESMEVELSGAVEGKAVWPSHLEPVAWHRDAYWARLKLGLYHSSGNVADGEVEYKDISVEGPNGIIRSTPVPSDDPCARDSKGNCKPINKTCKALAGNQIDWECVLGPDALSEVTEHGGEFKTCPDATESEPCSRFVVAKDKARAEVKVKDGIDGFPFRQGEEYIFKYSFKAKEGMQVGKLFTILGQLKGDTGDEMIKGVPIYSIVANNNGIMVRFSNLDESIPNYHPGLDDFLSWEDVLGKWVHVKVTTVLGESMEVELSGAVEGKAVWPSHLEPVAWHRDAYWVRLKLGLYHSAGNVADGEVEYKDISVEGPNGIIRSSSVSPAEDLSDVLSRGISFTEEAGSEKICLATQ